MSDERPTEVLGSLPRTRPHRRSEKRAARPAEPTTEPAATAEPADEAEPAANTGTKAAAKPKPGGGKPASTTRGRPAAKPRAKPAPTTRAKPGPGARAKSVAGTEAAPTPVGTPRAVPSGGRRRLPQPAQPGGTPALRGTRGSGRSAPASARRPERPARTEVLGTAVQAAAEIAEIGLSAGARAIRRAVSRLPRP